MSILAGVKGYLTYVTLGYKSLLELRRSLGDVDPLNLIKDKDATLQKGQEHADVLTREVDGELRQTYPRAPGTINEDFVAKEVDDPETPDAKMADGFIKTKKINVDDRATGDFDVDVDLGGS
ncbi:hypothetical protein GYH30_009992 [Glycine max]|nr:hypothetical protein JHK87_010095 [Glycine soja]KAH1111431.1 hypothetical protein GYH30_009992 [Glycine max]